MLKVAIIIERTYVALGGAERSTMELADELRRQGIDATLLAAKGDPAEHTQILCAHDSGKRTSLKQFKAALDSHLQQHSYDLIHSTLPLPVADIYQPRGGSYKETMLRNIASYPFALQRCIKRWTHLLNVRRAKYMDAERQLCSKGANTIIAALSDYVRRQFKQHYQLHDDRIAVIPNGINTRLKPNENTVSGLKETIRNSISIPEDRTPTFFLFAATNPRLKGLRPLLYALRKVRDTSNTDPVLILAGTDKMDGYYRRLINQFGLQNHVSTLGKLSGIQNALSVCDAAVLPTYYDPCSRFILEALAAGRPVITTRYNGASERYEHLKHGFIIDDPANTDRIADALAYFCDPEKIQLAHNAIVDDNLVAEVSIQKHVEQLIDLYNAVMAKKKS